MDAQRSSGKPGREEIFSRALDMALEERRAYLDKVCGEDGELRSEIEDLIKNHREDDLLENFIPETIQVAGEKVGDVIDRYKLAEEIGEGGWGIVYRAEQSRPFRRQVAFKIIKLGMDTKQVVRRFDKERRALASLDHTGIAKIYDAGSTSSGRPYFVMEWIRGKRITDYADEHQLTIPQRLELFVKVCKAVNHAHEKGIIHRDLKPSNILVAEEDGEPLPKVIDFGIAKATVGDGDSDTTFVTKTGQFLGTPNYMSPEQIDLNGRRIDHRTDIYSLGVILYELVTGSAPYDLSGKGFSEIIKNILEVVPSRPSVYLAGQPKATIEKLAKTRQTDPDTLLCSIEIELDSIIMACLEKDREKRIETVSVLLDPLNQYNTEKKQREQFKGGAEIIMLSSDPKNGIEAKPPRLNVKKKIQPVKPEVGMDRQILLPNNVLAQTIAAKKQTTIGFWLKYNIFWPLISVCVW